MKTLIIALLMTPALAQGENSGGTPQPEVSVILAKDRFYPAEVRLKPGVPVTLVFSSVNKKPAALILENTSAAGSIASDSPNEITREVSSENATFVSFEPTVGKYKFHDALGAARGEIIVE